MGIVWYLYKFKLKVSNPYAYLIINQLCSAGPTKYIWRCDEQRWKKTIW